jgi:hypothetical protein
MNADTAISKRKPNFLILIILLTLWHRFARHVVDPGKI